MFDYKLPCFIINYYVLLCSTMDAFMKKCHFFRADFHCQNHYLAVICTFFDFFVQKFQRRCIWYTWAPYVLKKNYYIVIGYKRIQISLFYLQQPFIDTLFELLVPSFLQCHLYTILNIEWLGGPKTHKNGCTKIQFAQLIYWSNQNNINDI